MKDSPAAVKSSPPWIYRFEGMTNYLVESAMYAYLYDGTDLVNPEPGTTPVVKLESGAIFTVICAIKGVNVQREPGRRLPAWRPYFVTCFTLVLHNEQLLLLPTSGPCTALPSKP